VLSGDHDIHVSKDELDTDNFRSDCALSRGSASAAMSPTHPEIQNAEAPICPSLNTTVSEICGKESQDCQDKGYSGSLRYGIDGNVDVFASYQITEAIVIDSKCNSLDLDGEGYQEHQSACKSSSNGEAVLSTSLVNQPALTTADGSFESPNNNDAEEKVINSMSLKETTNGESKPLNEMDRVPLNDDKAISEHTPIADVCEIPRELYDAADFHNTVCLDATMQQERQVGKGGDKEIIQSTHISAKELCESTSGEYAKELHDEVILESAKQIQIQNENRTNEEPVSSYVAKGASVTIPEIGCSEVS
ncbi:putative lysine-specific demethylase ELF6-like, partial [Trifolium medium]|nr:putative lysine-specific demethylase ELF6-like [Trifolium medium]